MREVKITPLPDALVATVEFQERVDPFFLAALDASNPISRIASQQR